jgi:hypothetical protein
MNTGRVRVLPQVALARRGHEDLVLGAGADRGRQVVVDDHVEAVGQNPTEAPFAVAVDVRQTGRLHRDVRVAISGHVEDIWLVSQYHRRECITAMSGDPSRAAQPPHQQRRRRSSSTPQRRWGDASV